LLFESSRGCWWGQKKPCRFCGFCAAWRTYRQKSAARVLEEIFYLWERYGIGSLDATDNAMPPKYFKDVLPAVARRRKPDQFLFYEIRPTTTPAQVAQLAKAGFLLAQPGIESLVTPVLKKMGKGTSAPQNIVLLRECRARRISACWNFLFGIPGEKRRDYEMLCDALPALFHLEAPQSFGPVRLDRYSEYFERPVRYGFRNLRPLPILRSLFPPHADFREIFAVLEKDWNTELLDDQPLFDRLKGLFLQWHDLWRSKGSPPALEALPTPSGRMVIHDTRPCAVETAFVADAQAAAVLKRLNKPVRVRDARCLPKDVLQELLRRRFVLKYEGRLLTLVTRASRGPAC
jgi:ribosomal peptide maturation radical SAM protein 1